MGKEETIEVAVAIGDEHAAGWVELTLAAAPGARVTLARGEVLHGAKPFDALVVDGDDPGPGFLPFYRRLRLVRPELRLLALGGEQAPVLQAVEWDPARTLLLPKPYRLEEVLDAFRQLTEKLKLPPVEQTVMDGLATGRGNAGPPRARPADLLQMLCINLWTGKVELLAAAGVHGTGRRGVLFLEAGALVHAEAAGREGEAACRETLRWGDCEFATAAEARTDRRTIRRTWEEVVSGGTSVPGLGPG